MIELICKPAPTACEKSGLRIYQEYGSQVSMSQFSTDINQLAIGYHSCGNLQIYLCQSLKIEILLRNI
jgi:hypothetical protein